MTTFLAILFGVVVAGVATYIGSITTKKVKVAHWVVNIILGALGAVAANQLLAGVYGPVILNLSVVPMLAGSLVLAGIGTWCVNKAGK